MLYFLDLAIPSIYPRNTNTYDHKKNVNSSFILNTNRETTQMATKRTMNKQSMVN